MSRNLLCWVAAGVAAWWLFLRKEEAPEPPAQPLKGTDKASTRKDAR